MDPLVGLLMEYLAKHPESTHGLASLQISSILGDYTYCGSNPGTRLDTFGFVESETILNKWFGKTYVRVDVEIGSEPPIHCHVGATKAIANESRYWFRGTRFDEIPSGLFKNLMSNPAWKAELKAAIEKAKLLVKGAGIACAAITIVIALEEAAQAAGTGGASAGARSLVGSGAQAAGIYAGSVGIGYGAAAISSGGIAVAGTTAAASVGGAVIAVGALGYAGGSAIANTSVGGKTVSQYEGDFLYWACSICWSW